jgi:hypothetical protein
MLCTAPIVHTSEVEKNYISFSSLITTYKQEPLYFLLTNIPRSNAS